MPRYSSFARHESMNLWLSGYLNVLRFAFLTGKPAFKFYFHNLTLMTKLCGNDFNSEKSILLHESNIKSYFNNIDSQSLICNSKTFLKSIKKSKFFHNFFSSKVWPKLICFCEKTWPELMWHYLYSQHIHKYSHILLKNY